MAVSEKVRAVATRLRAKVEYIYDKGYNRLYDRAHNKIKIVAKLADDETQYFSEIERLQHFAALCDSVIKCGAPIDDAEAVCRLERVRTGLWMFNVSWCEIEKLSE